MTAARISSRLVRARDALVVQAGPVAAAIAILLVGWSAVEIVCWPLGMLAHALQPFVDEPVFTWTQTVLPSQGPLASVAGTVMTMGDSVPVGVVTIVASVLLAFLWRRRIWWVPPLLLLTAFVSELVLQKMLQLLVDRGHPPTAVGSYPSGGSARVVAIYGLVLFLILLTWPGIRPRRRILGWIVVAGLALAEGLARLVMLQHWATDVLGGWAFGTLLLLVTIAAASAFVARSAGRDPASVGSQRQ